VPCHNHRCLQSPVAGSTTGLPQICNHALATRTHVTLPRTILFDLDGTLVDTAPDLAGAMNHVLAALDRPPLPVDAVRHLVGHGARALIARGLAATGDPAPHLIEPAMPLFLQYYADHIADASRAFDGVEAALDALGAAGCVAAICTNKPTALANALVAALGWQGRFAAVIGHDSAPRPKPDAAHVLAALEACGGDAGNAAFVGDSVTDVGAARNAGLPIILVSFGFTDVPAHALGGDMVIDHYDALVPALKALRT
jgi:phosphoglycolate phosphatase